MSRSRRSVLLGISATLLTPLACRRGASPSSGTIGRLVTTTGAGRSGAFYACENKGSPSPLFVFMHGTGGSGLDVVTMLRTRADERKFHIVAPDSRISPGGQATWEVGDHPGERTPDYDHVLACVDEFTAKASVNVDRSRTLAAGFSGGASMAPYLATNDHHFACFAILHGGVFPGGLGARAVRGWISTGDTDPLRSPAEMERHHAELRTLGFQITRSTFPGGHVLGDAEVSALLRWWLG